MFLGRKFGLLVFGGAALIAQMMSVQAANTCLAYVSKQHLDAKIAYQQDLARLVAKTQPSMKTLSDMNAAQQIIMAKLRHQKILFLLANDPGRLNTQGGMARFANFEWSRQETVDLRGRDQTFDTLSDELAALRVTLKGHADWPTMRDLFRTKIMRSPTHIGLLKMMKVKQTTAEAKLATCG